MPAGRPPTVATPEEFEALAQKYFDGCKEKKEPLTVSGLAMALGFCNRASFYDYERKPEYTNVVKRSRAVVEQGYEIRLHGNNPTGAIFALKNMGWTDRQRLEMSGPDGGPIETKEMTDAQIQERASQLTNRLKLFMPTTTNGSNGNGKK